MVEKLTFPVIIVIVVNYYKKLTRLQVKVLPDPFMPLWWNVRHAGFDASFRNEVRVQVSLAA